MLLSVFTPDSGRDEEDNTEALETVHLWRHQHRVEAWSTLAGTSESLTALNGMVCVDPIAEVVVRMSSLMKMRLLQLLKEFNCTVTSTWAHNEDSGECHTW